MTQPQQDAPLPLAQMPGIGDGLARLAVEYGGLSPDQFEQSMLALCVPRGATDEIIGALVATALVTKLNPLMQEVEILPLAGGPKVYIRSGGWAKILNRDPRVAKWKVSHTRDEKGVVQESTLVVTFKDGNEKEWSIDTEEWVVAKNANWRTRRTHMSALRALSVGTKYVLGLNLGHHVAGDEDELQRVKDVQAEVRPAATLDSIADGIEAKITGAESGVPAPSGSSEPAAPTNTAQGKPGSSAPVPGGTGEYGSAEGVRQSPPPAPPTAADRARDEGPPDSYQGGQMTAEQAEFFGED